ncbi:hypothetical protein P7C71_g2073, partial [Lecanoromycetidae sp. Uapishka_2]
MEVLTFAPYLFVLFIIYVIGLCSYRMYFDSLSHIPGPKLAAASLWYEFYYDVVVKGQYTYKIRELHEKYGPVIRISPYEVHINDPEYIDTVYPGSASRTMKYGWSMKMFGLRSSFIVTESHELHRIRRGALANYFSKSNLLKMEPGVQSQVDKLVVRFQEIRGDIIGQYAFARPYGFLDDPDFAPYWHKLMMEVSENGHILKQFGWMMPLMKSMPDWLVKALQPQMATLLDFQARFRSQVIEVKQQIAAGEKPPGQTTIFWDVLTNSQVRPQEKETDHLQDEAQTVIGAGTVTTGHILAITSFYIMSNPTIHQRLSAEITDVMSTTGDRPTWTQLEQLPYLTAVITEGLRIGYGISHRLQRLFPDTIVQYNGYAIPTMTPISMTSVLIHDNTDLFPNPRTFNPDRFLKQPALKRYLVPFSRGTRQCAGLNLAYAEFYLALAAVFAPGRFRLELFETDASDVETKHDFFVPSPRLDSKGIRAVVV